MGERPVLKIHNKIVRNSGFSKCMGEAMLHSCCLPFLVHDYNQLIKNSDRKLFFYGLLISREKYNKWQAQKWWTENYDRVMELYNVQRLNRQAFPLPPTPPRSPLPPTPPRSEAEVSHIPITILKFRCNYVSVKRSFCQTGLLLP